MNSTLLTQIFDYLRNGHILSEDSNEELHKSMFRYLDDKEHFEKARTYFEVLGIELESGEGYFYFSRPNQPISSIEKKIKTAYKWIDILDFFRTYDNTFGVGTTFEPAEIKIACNENIVLKEKLERVSGKSKGTPIEHIKSIANDLVKHDFAIPLFGGERYQVLSAIRYLDRLINLIHIRDDETTT